jgi:predicted Zn-dependent protease
MPPAAAQSGTDRPSQGNLPSLGDGEGMTLSAERRMGDRIARGIYRDPDYLDDPVLVDYLQSLWQPLLGAARDRGDVAPELSERLAWELMISRDRRVNAFALPGGYLGVHLGLVAVTERPEELASVLAHELSHVSQRHIARMVSRDERMTPWMVGAMILAALAAGSNAQAAGAAIAGGTAAAAQSQLNFSRDMEREADRVGYGVLTGAGFDGYGFVTMFDRLQQASRHNDDGSFPYLRSHPLTGERIADMRARLPQGPVTAAPVPPGVAAAASAPAGGALRLDLPKPGARADGAASTAAPASAVLHSLMAARARVLAENGPDRMRAWLNQGQAGGATPGDRYAAALSAHRLGQRETSLELAQRLRTAVPAAARPTVDALLLELLLAPRAGASAGASPPVDQAQLLSELRDSALAGTTRASAIYGAQAAIATGQAERATGRLQSWVSQHPRDALAWQTLSRAHASQGQTLRAIRADAEARAAQLDYSGAAERLRAAQELPAAQRTDGMELAIVDARRREVEALLRESTRED